VNGRFSNPLASACSNAIRGNRDNKDSLSGTFGLKTHRRTLARQRARKASMSFDESRR
jgi:hypothetical protein